MPLLSESEAHEEELFLMDEEATPNTSGTIIQPSVNTVDKSISLNISETQSRDEWMLDSGCTFDMCP